MSYILEALKRADAERERGAVPTLRSHAAPATASPTAKPAARIWIAVLAAAIVLLLGALWWTLMRPVPTVTLAAPAPAPAPAPAVVTVAPAPAVAAPAPAPVAPPRAAAPTVPKVPEPRSTARATPPRPAISAVAAATAAPVKPAAPASLVFSVAELPDDVRQQLPKLAISGGTYSAQAAYRMLIVNGQVLHENDQPAPGLTLETIREKDVVLRFKGYRYSLGY